MIGIPRIPTVERMADALEDLVFVDEITPAALAEAKAAWQAYVEQVEGL